MEMIQKETFKQQLVETNKPDSQKDKKINFITCCRITGK